MIFIDDYPIDIAKSETYSFESEVTDFPVEEGANVSDHIRTNPVVITLECVVSNTPIGLIAQDPSRQALDFDRDLAVPDAETPVPANDAFERLVAIWKARKPVSIDTSRGRFDNMVLSLEFPISLETSGGLVFTATLKQIEIVENRRVTIKQSAVPRGVGKVNKGAVAAFDGRGVIATLVFTLRKGKWLRAPEGVTTPPYWVTDPNKVLVLTSPNGDQHYKAENGAYADGTVTNAGKYIGFKKPFPTGMAVAPVTSDGTPIPQTTDYVSPLEQRIGPRPVESWQDAWTSGYTKGVFGGGQ